MNAAINSLTKRPKDIIWLELCLLLIGFAVTKDIYTTISALAFTLTLFGFLTKTRIEKEIKQLKIDKAQQEREIASWQHRISGIKGMKQLQQQLLVIRVAIQDKEALVKCISAYLPVTGLVTAFTGLLATLLT